MTIKIILFGDDDDDTQGGFASKNYAKSTAGYSMPNAAPNHNCSNSFTPGGISHPSPKITKRGTPDIMESYEDCGERGYQALLWLLSQPDTSHDEKNDDNNGNNGNGNNDNETTILVVAHGGLLRFSLVDHPLIKLVDGREDSEKRFSNCELREYDVSICTETKDQNTCSQGQGQGQERPVVILTEIR